MDKKETPTMVEKVLSTKEVETTTEIVINGIALRKKFANLYRTWGIDEGLEKDGIWVVYPTEEHEEIEFKIKRAGARNVEWRKTYAQTMRPHQTEIDEGKLTEQENKFLLAEIYSKAVVIDWKGIKDSDGKPVPFSFTNCVELLCFMPELLQEIIKDAHERSNFIHLELENTAKN